MTSLVHDPSVVRERRESINDHCHKDLQRVSGWSPWYPAILPSQPKNAAREYKRRHEGAKGYYSTFLYNETNDENPLQGCGVYEMMVETLKQRYPVYLGSTCRRKRTKEHGPCPNCQRAEKHICPDSNMCERISEYLEHGSHKRELINAVMQCKCTVFVRARRFRSSVSDDDARSQAQKFENSLLSRYDYAWNRRNPDGSIKRLRHVPPEILLDIPQEQEEERKKEEEHQQAMAVEEPKEEDSEEDEEEGMV